MTSIISKFIPLGIVFIFIIILIILIRRETPKLSKKKASIYKVIKG